MCREPGRLGMRRVSDASNLALRGEPTQAEDTFLRRLAMRLRSRLLIASILS